MQLLAREFAERAERAPGDVAVIDALGVHTVGEVMAAAREPGDRARGVPRRLADRPGPGRQHLADPGDGARRRAARRHGRGVQQPRGRGRVRARHGGHRAGRRGRRRRRARRSGRSRARRSPTSGRRSTAGPWSPPGGPASDVERWAGGVAVAMTSGSTGRPKCVVQSEESLRYAGRSTIDAIGLAPGDAVGAFVPLSSVAAFCFGMYLPAMLGGPMVCIDAGGPTTPWRPWPRTTSAGRCWCRRWRCSSRSARRRRAGCRA